MMNKINAVCVYSASSTKIDSVYFETAHELGTLLAQNGIHDTLGGQFSIQMTAQTICHYKDTAPGQFGRTDGILVIGPSALIGE